MIELIRKAGAEVWPIKASRGIYSEEVSKYLVRMCREVSKYLVGMCREVSKYLVGMCREVEKYLVGMCREVKKYLVGMCREVERYLVPLSGRVRGIPRIQKSSCHRVIPPPEATVWPKGALVIVSSSTVPELSGKGFSFV